MSYLLGWEKQQQPASSPEPRALSPVRVETRAGARGVTLIELLVVLGIIGLIVGMSVPGFVAYSQRLRVKATTRQLVGLLSLARSLSISSHESHAVVIDPAAAEVTVMNTVSGQRLEQVLRLPSSVRLTLEVAGEPSTDTEVAFRPTGALVGRTASFILVDDQHQRYAITVIGTTGAVSVQ